MSILEVEGITKRFGGLVAISDVSFQIDQGESVGLIGPNGAGKTTLFNLISGAIAPDSGVIKYKGKKISGLKPHRICKMGVARTFQSVKIFPNMTVLQNVLLAALFGTENGNSTADATRETMEVLELVGLSEATSALAKDLTLPNQKRLEIARALVTKPGILMLDELMAGLNPTEIGLAIELVKTIHNMGISIFIIEHNMNAILKVCERIIVFNFGEKIAEGTPESIITNPQVIEIYLGE